MVISFVNEIFKKILNNDENKSLQVNNYKLQKTAL